MSKDFRCIAVNNAYRIASWSEFVWFADMKWWDWHSEELLASRLPIATCCEHPKVLKHPSVSKLRLYARDSEHRYGISEKKGFVAFNSSSGASAINLAYHMGARKVVLLGFDMRRVHGEKNWHSDHKEQKNFSPFSRHMKAFGPIGQDAKRLGIEIVNCTPNSAIEEFPIISLEEALQ